MGHNGYSAVGLLYSFALYLHLLHIGNGDVTYSIPEEMQPGTVIGNIAKDLGLDVGKLSARKARIDSEMNRKRYCDLNLSAGDLTVAERIDRETLCGEKISCFLTFELVLEAPLELHRISLQIQDINDNSPVFLKDEIKIEINELADKGSRFRINEAHDVDVGQNAVQSYALQGNGHLVLTTQSKTDGSKFAELVLDKELDREEQQEFRLLLTASDGGSPQRTGSATVHVIVLDANDNAPVFSQAVYKASLPENSPIDTVVVTLTATDADEGLNGEVTEGNSFMTELIPKAAPGSCLVSKVIAVDADSGQNAWLSYHIVKSTDPELFTIGLHSGEIRTQRNISESDSMKQNLIVSVKDNGQPSLSATCTMYLIISDNLAEVPELKDISYDENNPKQTSYLIIALVCVSTFFLTFIIVILGVRFCCRRKPRLLFDGAVAIPSAYLPPNYSEVDGTGTLRSTYNYDAYLTTGSRTSDFKFVSAYNDNTLPADQTLRKSPSDFAEIFDQPECSPEVGCPYQ
ncbi:hypothetical protein LDENG_00140880 [Lucifuga dentata]|nr:hypothetical protein LDENG_00140880 [Lucifuga dentata]